MSILFTAEPVASMSAKDKRLSKELGARLAQATREEART